MNRFLIAAAAAIMCSTAIINPAAVTVSAAPVSAAVCTAQPAAAANPVTISRVTKFATNRMNFTLASPVVFKSFSSYYPVYAYGQSKKLNVTGMQLMFFNEDTGEWERPKNGAMGSIANGYFKTESACGKTITIAGMNVAGCPLYKGHYYKLTAVPVCFNSRYMTYAAPKYYTATVYYDLRTNRITSAV